MRRLLLALALAAAPLFAAPPDSPAKPKAVVVERFEDGRAWDQASGTWRVKDGKLVQSSVSGVALTFLRDLELTDHYMVEVDARKLGGAEGFFLIFNYHGKNVWWNIGGWGNTYSTVERVPGTRTDLRVAAGRLYHIKVVVDRSVAEGYIDGKREFRVDLPAAKVTERTTGPIGLGTFRTRAEYDNFKVTVYPGTPPRPIGERLAEERRITWRHEAKRERRTAEQLVAECDAILARNTKAPADLARRLAELRERPADAQAQQRARELKSECLLAELAGLPPIAFFTRHPFERPFGLGTYVSWDIARRWGTSIRVWDPGRPDAPPRVIFRDGGGVIFDMNVSYDAQTLFFSFKRRRGDSYHIYEIGVDGAGLKQITSGPYHDVHPLLLPDGRVLFVSTRAGSFALCQPGAATAMFVAERDGSKIQRISANTLQEHSPQMLPDGRVLFTRWEYVDRTLTWRQGLWTMNPDGTRVQLFFGNTVQDPAVFWQARPIPGRDAVVATFAPHHGWPHGAIGLVDNRHGHEAPRRQGFRWITKEFPRIGDRSFRWSYRDPFPISDHAFLAAYAASLGRFAIVLLDDRDNKELLYSDPATSCYNPLLLRPQTPPAVIAPHKRDAVPMGTYLLVDVYRGLRGVERGEVKSIQIMEQIPKWPNMRGQRAHDMDPLIGRGTYYVKKCWGTVPVEADGSAHFRAPALKEIYFQALDASGKELQRMGSATQLMPGEFQSCIGCHEGREQAPPNVQPLAAQRLPSTPTPPHWGNGALVDFARVVQPALDRHCVKCHSGPDPKKGLDLSGDKTRYFNMAYNNLVDRGYVHYMWLLRAPTKTLPPRSTGAQVSKLLRFVDDPARKVPLEDRQRIYTWIDANIPYYGTYEHTRPGKSGCRDLWADPWYSRQFAPVYQRRCGGCHRKNLAHAVPPVNGRRPAPAHRWVNLSRPEFSRVLTAPLAKSADGLDLCHPKGKKTPPVFASKSDPDYLALLAAIQAGHKAMLANPRVDMPGAKPKPYYREFNRVHTGFAGP